MHACTMTNAMDYMHIHCNLPRCAGYSYRQGMLQCWITCVLSTLFTPMMMVH